jgi:predicted metalloprotease
MARAGRRLVTRPAAALALAVVVTVALLTQVRGGISGQATAANYIDTAGVTADSGVVGVDDGQELLIGAIVADLSLFWSTALPPITGSTFTPLRGSIVAVDSSAASGSAPCVSTPPDLVGNAYHCPSDAGVVYDATTLIPVLMHRSGIGGLITTFAHEFGHAVQARVRSATAAASATPLVTEARADCDAGAFLAWVVAGNAPHVHVTHDILIPAIGPLVDFSDPATVSPDDPTAHGLAVDRLGWFLTGFRNGAAACARLGEPLETALGRAQGRPSATPRYATRSQLLAAAERSLDTFDDPRDTTSPLPGRTDAAARLNAAAQYGQFAQATVMALAAAPDGGDAVAAACFAGSWVHAVFGAASQDELGGWPGDPDEGLAAVLRQPDSSFAAVTAYIDAFHSGPSACRSGAR